MDPGQSTTPRKDIDIVIPVYNEECGLPAFDRELRRVLDTLQSRYRFHLIYVLDRSKDDSYGVIRAFMEETRDTTLLHLSTRFGHQMSLVAGFDHAHGDAVIMMDSDLQHPPELVPVLLQRFEEGNDIVQTVRSYGSDVSHAKRVTSRLFYRVQNALSPVELVQGAADFRLVSGRVMRVFQQQIREHHQFLRALFQWVGFRIAYVEFTSQPRVAGRTKYTLGRLLAFFGDGILSFSRLPLRLATFLGFVLSLASAAYGAFLLASFWIFGDLPRGYPSLILVMLFVGGLQLVMIGIIGEYVGHIFDEVKARPLYIVEELVTTRGMDE